MTSLCFCLNTLSRSYSTHPRGHTLFAETCELISNIAHEDTPRKAVPAQLRHLIFCAYSNSFSAVLYLNTEQSSSNIILLVDVINLRLVPQFQMISFAYVTTLVSQYLRHTSKPGSRFSTKATMTIPLHCGYGAMTIPPLLDLNGLPH